LRVVALDQAGDFLARAFPHIPDPHLVLNRIVMGGMGAPQAQGMVFLED
jgi:hypothetical protein